MSHDDDDGEEEDEDDQQIPIVEENLSDHPKRHLVGMDKHFDEVGGKVLPEEMETYDVHEIQQDGNGIGDDVDDVDKGLQLLLIDNTRRETVEDDGQDVDSEYDR